MSACDHHAQHRPSQATIRNAVELGRARCLAASQRWTAQRQRTFELLLEAGGPIKAYDLIAQFKTGAQTAPPTVYRALEALVGLGLVHRIASLNAYTACHLDAEGHSASFLICDCCGAAEEIAAPTGDVLDAIRTQSGFEPAHITIEAHGRCQHCQA
jgi:Fur family transcriptional regulator, zinc uptake regulator